MLECQWISRVFLAYYMSLIFFSCLPSPLSLQVYEIVRGKPLAPISDPNLCALRLLIPLLHAEAREIREACTQAMPSLTMTVLEFNPLTQFLPTCLFYPFHKGHNIFYLHSLPLIPTTRYQIPAWIGHVLQSLWKDLFFHRFPHSFVSFQVLVHSWPCRSRSLTQHPQEHSKCVDVVGRVTKMACTMVPVHFR